MSTADEPVSIAFCITELDPGGAERALVQLVTRLDRAQWQPAVYCLAGEAELVGKLQQHDIPVTCLGARGVGSVSVIPRLASLFRQQRPTLLQTFLYHANIVGRLAGRMAHVPHVVSGIRVAEQRSRFRLWLDRATDHWVSRHVCVSEAVAKFSIEQGGLPADKVVVIPNGVDGERYQTATAADLSEFGIPPGTPVVLYVGRLDPQKAPLDLLAALRMLAVQRDDFQALIVGDGPLRSELQSTIASSELNGRVHLIGRRDDVPELMQAASCLALPSRWEGMPNVVLEAMAAALPVVATEVEGSTELMRSGGESGDFGILVPPGSPEQMSAAIDRVLNTPADVTAMALASQHHVMEQFTWNRVTQNYCQLYRSLLDQTAR